MAHFWESKRLDEMSNAEWESLCDGCGMCCRLKEQDEDTGAVALTQIACRLLDITTGQCSGYANRHKEVPECLNLTHENVEELTWLPPSCAYRLLSQGYSLPDWHPLITGDPESPHEAGYTIRDRAISEADALL
jgi:uncharacterized cysteine cluster protein YcgN (CxxCxxCC family)